MHPRSVWLDEVEELPLLARGNTHQLATARLPDRRTGGDVLRAGVHSRNIRWIVPCRSAVVPPER